MKTLYKANPKLSSNIKIVVDGEGIRLEVIAATETLSDAALRIDYETSQTFGQNVRRLSRLVYDNKDLFDLPDEPNKLASDYSEQVNPIYTFGAYSDTSNLSDKKFRFFAPLFKDGEGLPDGFVIEDNEGKPIAVFDLKSLGVAQIIAETTKESGVAINFADGEILASGIDLETGEYGVKKLDTLDTLIETERTVTEFENEITGTLQQCGIIDTRFMNVEFCFDLPDGIDGFVDVRGYYVTFSETEKSNLYMTTELCIVSDSHEHTQYFETIDVVDTVSVSENLSPILQFTVNNIPPKNSKLSLADQNGTVFYTSRFGSDVIDNKSLDNTIKLITNQLNKELRALPSHILICYRYGNRIVIESGVERDIQVYDGTVVCTQKPNTFTTDNMSMHGAGLDSFRVRGLLEGFTHIKYGDVTTTTTDVSAYLDTFVYRCSDVLSDEEKFGKTVTLLNNRTGVYYGYEPFDMYHFDYDHETTDYASIIDFDVEAFGESLIATIEQDSFLGKYETRPDEATLTAYKDELLTGVRRYVDSIDRSEPSLIRSIDLVTKEATALVGTEYDRLSENHIISLLRKNILLPYICKFAHRDGLDAYARPLRLSVALPFRFDGGIVMNDVVDRDIRYHTHAWFIVGEGTPDYVTGEQANGYSAIPLTVTDFTETTSDAYDNIRDYATIKERDGISTTIFRGIKYHIQQGFDGYRFAAVLLTKTPPENTDRDIKVVVNDTFKTVTLVVNSYFPEPILTSLERGDEFYRMDRSLLYYSSGSYTTNVELNGFGTSDISLNLFDSSSTKSYAGTQVGKDWLQTIDGRKAIYVSRGDTTRFSENMGSLIAVGGDFQVSYSGTDATDYLNYGMVVVFKDIIDVGTSYFWCSDIEIRFIKTDNWETTETTDDVVTDTTVSFLTEYLTNGEVILSDVNITTILKPIMYYNAVYLKTIKNTVSASKYSAISSASVMGYLNNRNVPMLRGGVESSMQLKTIEPDTLHVAIELQSEGNELSLLNERYALAMYRHSGYYDPILKPVVGLYEYKRKVSNKFSLPNILDNQSRSKGDVWFYRSSITEQAFDGRFFNTSEVSEQIDWIAQPREVRGIVSRILNTDKTISIAFNEDVGTMLYELSERVMRGVDIPQNTAIILHVSDYIDENNIQDHNINEIVLEQLVSALFGIYVVSRVVDTYGNEIPFTLSEDRTAISADGASRVEFVR